MTLPEKVPQLAIDIDVENVNTCYEETFTERRTIAARSLVKFAELRYDYNNTTKSGCVYLHIKYLDCDNRFHSFEINKLDYKTTIDMYEALLRCIKYKDIDLAKNNTSKDEAVKKLSHVIAFRYVEIKATLKNVTISYEDDDNEHDTFTFERLD